MESYIALLRGINVSGRNIIKMNDLKALFIHLGFHRVQSYVQSGNVLFQSNKKEKHIFEKHISDEIKTQFGLDVPVLVLTSSELKSIIHENPFKNDLNEAFFHFIFLKFSVEHKINHQLIENKKGEEEQFEFSDKGLYLYCPDGYGNTKLHNRFLENTLKTKATTRNWKTCLALVKYSEEN